MKTLGSFVYVDNSNVWIEGMHVSAVKKGYARSVFDAQINKICDYSWKFDFGRMLQFAGGDKTDIKKAVLFGSKPPENDSLWTAARLNGFQVVAYDRNYNNREKKIDTDIVATMMEDSYEYLKIGTDDMVLVAGDRDYVPALEKLMRRGIKVYVCFWSHAADELKRQCTKFFALDPHLEYLRLAG